MTLFDLTNGISWTTDKKIFFTPKNDISNAELNLIDYLNEISLNDIEKDINILSELNTIIEKGDKKHTEQFIMDTLQGFTQYDDGIYAFITGATDQSPSVLYDINDSLFLIHPNLSINDKLKISPLNLIELLNNKKVLIQVLDSNKIQEI